MKVIAADVSTYTITLGAGEQIEVGSFTYCGDGIYQALDDEAIAEECDGSDINGQSCSSVLGDSNYAGNPTCSASCTFDTSDCKKSICNITNNGLKQSDARMLMFLSLIPLFIIYWFFSGTGRNNYEIFTYMLIYMLGVLIFAGLIFVLGGNIIGGFCR
jgi:hypothetical protein